MSPSNAGNTSNWPDTIFKWVLTAVGSGIFIIGTNIFAQLDKMAQGQSAIKDSQNDMRTQIEKTIDAIHYIREDVIDLKTENKELRREIEKLKEEGRRR